MMDVNHCLVSLNVQIQSVKAKAHATIVSNGVYSDGPGIDRFRQCYPHLLVSVTVGCKSYPPAYFMKSIPIQRILQWHWCYPWICISPSLEDNIRPEFRLPTAYLNPFTKIACFCHPWIISFNSVMVKSKILELGTITCRKLDTAAGVNGINLKFWFFFSWHFLNKLFDRLVFSSRLPSYFYWWLPFKMMLGDIASILVLKSLKKRKDKLIDKLSHIHFDINCIILVTKTFVKGIRLFLSFA